MNPIKQYLPFTVSVLLIGAAGLIASADCPNGPPVPPGENHGHKKICKSTTPCDEAVIIGPGFTCRSCTAQLLRGACDSRELGDPFPPEDHDYWTAFMEGECGEIIEGDNIAIDPYGNIYCDGEEIGLCCHRAVCFYDEQE